MSDINSSSKLAATASSSSSGSCGDPHAPGLSSFKSSLSEPGSETDSTVDSSSGCCGGLGGWPTMAGSNEDLASSSSDSLLDSFGSLLPQSDILQQLQLPLKPPTAVVAASSNNDSDILLPTSTTTLVNPQTASQPQLVVPSLVKNEQQQLLSSSKLLLVQKKQIKAVENSSMSKTSGSLLRNALTAGKPGSAKAKNGSSLLVSNNNNNDDSNSQLSKLAVKPSAVIPGPTRTYTDKPSPQKVEEIILLAMKKTGTLDTVGRVQQQTAAGKNF